ncbi:TVP38/TMEM64 family protein [Candidatus Woesearchaeota archaeon]|nr:TVP38/TMEM64 family protein [Candidatus Woesearchaeota archaeon]
MRIVRNSVDFLIVHIDILLGILILAMLLTVYMISPLRTVITLENAEHIGRSFGIYGPLVYGLAYALLGLGFIGMVPFAILAGILFGKVVGILVIVIASTFSAWIAFTIGRRISNRDHRLMKQLLKNMEKSYHRNGFLGYIQWRCMFIPAIVVSYAAGMLKSSDVKLFLTATLLTNILFISIYVSFGDTLAEGAYLIAGVLLLVTLALSWLLKKYAAPSF